MDAIEGTREEPVASAIGTACSTRRCSRPTATSSRSAIAGGGGLLLELFGGSRGLRAAAAQGLAQRADRAGRPGAAFDYGGVEFVGWVTGEAESTGVTAKQDALVEVVDLITRHGLTIDDVSAALAGRAEFAAQRSSSIVSRIFAYLGGTFVFVGLGIFVGMRWDDLGPAGRVLLTLGPGLCLFVLALVCTTDARVEGAATPLFLVAALVQPTGILVMLREYGRGGEAGARRPVHERRDAGAAGRARSGRGAAPCSRSRRSSSGAIAVVVSLDLLDANMYVDRRGDRRRRSSASAGASIARRTARLPAWSTSSAPRCCSRKPTRGCGAEPLEILFLGAGVRRRRPGGRGPQPEPAGRRHGGARRLHRRLHLPAFCRQPGSAPGADG